MLFALCLQFYIVQLLMSSFKPKINNVPAAFLFFDDAANDSLLRFRSENLLTIHFPFKQRVSVWACVTWGLGLHWWLVRNPYSVEGWMSAAILRNQLFHLIDLMESSEQVLGHIIVAPI